MSFSIKGYVVEPIRVGTGNSPFTASPTVYISNSSAYSAVYTSAESVPRTEYVAFVLVDGRLPDAKFGWSKNETIQRIDYSGPDGQFKPLVGSSPTVLGSLSDDVASGSNIKRIKAPAPTSPGDLSAPYRLSVGLVGSGVEFTINLVTSFGSPTSGTVELNTTTGELNWNSIDLTTHNGEPVKFQRQQFFTSKESTGFVGNLTDPFLFLNPIPGIGVGSSYQVPLIRIGQGLYLPATSVADEAALSSFSVPYGEVAWAVTTGQLKFNSSFVSNFSTGEVFYDGVLFASDLSLPRQVVGTVTIPGTLNPAPAAGGDVIFRISGVHQFATSTLVTSFDPVGKSDEVQYTAIGNVQFSQADRSTFGSATVEAIICDLELERGLSVRFFRSPVDPQAVNPTVKDVSAIYTVRDQTLAKSIIASSQVSLPAVPIEDPDYPTNFHIEQGTGTITGPLTRLDGPSPPLAPFGYRIDPISKTFFFSARKQKVLDLQLPTSNVMADPLVFEPNFLVEVETGTGTNTYTTLTHGNQILIEPLSGNVSFVNTTGTIILTSSSGSVTAGTLTDTVDLSNVQTGDTLVVFTDDESPTSPVGVYDVTVTGSTITIDPLFSSPGPLTYEVRRGVEVLADRFFQELNLTDPITKVERITELGIASNSPRLSINKSKAGKTRLRYGSGSTGNFSTTVTIVDTDGDFSSPSILPPYTAEISAETGNINLSSTDESSGVKVFSVILQTEKTDYRIDPVRGLIQFVERMLAKEEALITYKKLGNSTIIQERATFLVRKEKSQDHPSPTSTISFNPLGREVATNPTPQVFRGGRPQTFGTQFTLDSVNSTVTFLTDTVVTNVLPHGSVVGPTENILIDYYVYQALGGENTTTLLQPPLDFAKPQIVEDQDSSSPYYGKTVLTVGGDFTTSLPTDFLLRIENEEVYQIGSVTYHATSPSSYIAASSTVMTLAGAQQFKQTISGPKMSISSGPVGSDYYVTELNPYDTASRGSNKIRVAGNVTNTYGTGTVLQFSSAAPVLDYYYVTGAQYIPESNRTELTLSTTTTKQYTYGTHILRRSVRPIFESAPTDVQTSRPPVLQDESGNPNYLVFRRVLGSKGELLRTPKDFSIDGSGKVKFGQALLPNQSFNILYTGIRLQAPGPKVRLTYTYDIAPSASNGLLGQSLLADFSLYSPDSFYFRVEKLSNFRGELEQQYKSAASSSAPSGGPRTSNAGGSTNLWEKGSQSVYFDEIHLANEDIVAKATLKFYNDSINYLDDVLSSMDGRVIGDSDGRFRFDNIVNQIDDMFRISDFPYTVTINPFSINYIGTYQKAYDYGPASRFYPTQRNVFNVVTKGASDPTPPKTGDAILDTGYKKLTSVYNVRKRTPRALISKKVHASDTTINITDASGSTDLLPDFEPGMKVVVKGGDGTDYIDDSGALTVSSISPGLLDVGNVGVDIPAGSTVFLAPSDTTYPKIFQIGRDLTYNADQGSLLYVTPYPPLDGSVPEFASIKIQTPNTKDVLQMDLTYSNVATEPEKIPALYGGSVDDDGDTSIPIMRLDCETTEIDNEIDLTDSFTGILSDTTPPFVGTGTALTSGRTVITSATWPSPAPKVDDLLRITVGSNAGSSYRRITAVNTGLQQITVCSAFPNSEITTFTFQVTTSTPVLTSSAGIGTTSSLLVDTTNLISSGVKVGHTVVFPTLTARRQIVSIDSTGYQATLDYPVTGLMVGTSYRIENTLNTFGGVEDLYDSVTLLKSVVSTNVSPVASEKVGLEQYLEAIFTDLQSLQTGAVSGTTLTGSSSFQAILDPNNTGSPTVQAYVYIRSGIGAGIYDVTSYMGNTLQVGDSFSSSGVADYRIVSVFGSTKKNLVSFYGILSNIDSLIANIEANQPNFSSVPVIMDSSGLTDPSVYANGTVTSDVTNWNTVVTSRKTQLVGTGSGGDRQTLTNLLTSGDKIYDKRFTWIDARINQEKGILPKISRAAGNRIKAQADTLKQLIKLLAVQG